ncbi:MAG: ABC transporter ATP-binding protein, partial [Bacteroidia bacterium]|nr:ABC transporter ATP-binding protein [Bacteroidia bacterium]
EKLYSGRVDEMISSHGFFEMRCEDNDSLINLLEAHDSIGKITVENELITAFLDAPMEATEINRFVFEKGVVLSHLVKRKESLEEQFLQLTDKSEI